MPKPRKQATTVDLVRDGRTVTVSAKVADHLRARGWTDAAKATETTTTKTTRRRKAKSEE